MCTVVGKYVPVPLLEGVTGYQSFTPSAVHPMNTKPQFKQFPQHESRRMFQTIRTNMPFSIRSHEAIDFVPISTTIQGTRLNDQQEKLVSPDWRNLWLLNLSRTKRCVVRIAAERLERWIC